MTIAEVADLILDSLPADLEVEEGRERLRIILVTEELPRTREPARDAAQLPDGTRTVHELVDMDREGLTGERSNAQIVPSPRRNRADRAPAAEGARPAEIRPARAVDGTEDFRGIPLSERERAVLRLVAEGCANKQIARELMLS